MKIVIRKTKEFKLEGSEEEVLEKLNGLLNVYGEELTEREFRELLKNPKELVDLILPCIKPYDWEDVDFKWGIVVGGD